jgi:hypothetical protein
MNRRVNTRTVRSIGACVLDKMYRAGKDATTKVRSSTSIGPLQHV